MDPMSRSCKVFSFPSSPLERNVEIANNEVVIATPRDALVVAMTRTATKIGGGRGVVDVKLQ